MLFLPLLRCHIVKPEAIAHFEEQVKQLRKKVFPNPKDDVHRSAGSGSTDVATSGPAGDVDDRDDHTGLPSSSSDDELLMD